MGYVSNPSMKQDSHTHKHQGVLSVGKPESVDGSHFITGTENYKLKKWTQGYHYQVEILVIYLIQHSKQVITKKTITVVGTVQTNRIGILDAQTGVVSTLHYEESKKDNAPPSQ